MTAKYKSEFLRVCEERGFIHQITDAAALDEYLKNGGGIGYIGFDCTAKSLHVGSLIQIMLLRWFQKTGNKPIVLMGGATSRIGDPSFKDTARPALSDETIAHNMAGIKKVFHRFIDFDEGNNKAVMVNNADWMDKLGYLTLMAEVGRHFSINRMLSMDSVKLRLGREDSEMSFLEFNYMIMQAYDFEHLYKSHGVRLQMGGSDQWGNIIGGVELHRRICAAANQGKQNTFDAVFGMTSPLITTSSGAKMGKTASGAVWLNSDMLSTYDYWQYFRNTEDADVGRFLRMFTELPISEIEKLEKLKDAEINEAKKILATEATKLCHGKEAAEAAMETARKTFEEGAIGDNLPSISMPYEIIKTGTAKVVECFTSSGLTKSNSEARTLIGQGAAKINDQKISDQTYALKESDFVNGVAKLSAGKKKHALVKLTR